MRAIDQVIAEVERATVKFPTWPTDPLHALAVLGEEFGELTKEVLQMAYEPHKTNKDKVRIEAIQTAAMALRFVASLDKYEYKPGIQHPQYTVYTAMHRQTSEGDRFVGRNIHDIEALAAQGLREDGLPD